MNIADAVTAAKGLAMTSSERYNGLVSRLTDHVERGYHRLSGRHYARARGGVHRRAHLETRSR